MPESLESLVQSIDLATLIDIGITALLIYWLFSLIRGTRAVTLIIGVSVLLLVYAAAQLLQLRLLSQILQTGAFIGIFALVVVFQPELRRALERIGRVGSLRWLLNPGSQGAAEHVSREVARAASGLAAEGTGALIVIERETGVGEIAETGVRIDGELTADLLRTLFSPRSPLHDGAVIIREDRVVAAGALLPLAETTLQSERLGTRHRAALGLTEQTDAVVVVVSEERGQVSIVERARIVRNLTEPQIERALAALLEPASGKQPGGARKPGRRPSVRLMPPRSQVPQTPGAVAAADPDRPAERNAPGTVEGAPNAGPVATSDVSAAAAADLLPVGESRVDDGDGSSAVDEVDEADAAPVAGAAPVASASVADAAPLADAAPVASASVASASVASASVVADAADATGLAEGSEVRP